jgi:3-phosphoshikimate 1-carboxyvinyltransferase
MTLGGETLLRAAADMPIAAALAARARGPSRVRDAIALQRRDAGLLRSTVTMLRAFGVACEEDDDGMNVIGRDGPFAAADFDCRGDPTLAMTAAVLALAADGPSRVVDAACIADRYPKFVATLRALGVRVDVNPSTRML